MIGQWSSGNCVSLLENGEEFFPRIVDLIGEAQQEILIETFILREDKVGNEIKRALIAAAQRGVRVALTVDGYGSFYLSQEYISALTNNGILFCMYDPPPHWISFRTNVFRRLHRKLVVVDGRHAFVGGINLSYNHLCEYGPDGKQDYAVELRGPVVREVRQRAVELLEDACHISADFHSLETPDNENAGKAQACFVVRDNSDNRSTIESAYIDLVSKSQRQVTIVNAYFFPGYRLLRELRNAARRGVHVRLVIQGKPGSALAQRFSPTLYDFLVESGIEVYEYWERPLHAKVATIDDEWSTVGSSNLDPLSLSLNLEANVFIRDQDFNTHLTERMSALTEHSEIRKVNDQWIKRRTLWKWFRSLMIFHFLRHFPAWVGWLPAHTPRVVTEPVKPAKAEVQQ